LNNNLSESRDVLLNYDPTKAYKLSVINSISMKMIKIQGPALNDI